MAQMVMNLPAMQKTWVLSPGSIPWRKDWLPTPVFLPGEFHGQRSLVGCSPWGHKESDTTEQLKQILKNSPIHMKMKNVSSKIKDDHYKWEFDP